MGRRALLEEESPQFPVGSVIVREKLATASDDTPQLLVALVKRAHGFNPGANDWEFLVLNVSETNHGRHFTVSRREKTGSCRDCHVRQKGSDFVFRTYLTEAARR